MKLSKRILSSSKAIVLAMMVGASFSGVATAQESVSVESSQHAKHEAKQGKKDHKEAKQAKKAKREAKKDKKAKREARKAKREAGSIEG